MRCMKCNVSLWGGEDAHVMAGVNIYQTYCAVCCPGEYGGEPCLRCERKKTMKCDVCSIELPDGTPEVGKSICGKCDRIGRIWAARMARNEVSKPLNHLELAVAMQRASEVPPITVQTGESGQSPVFSWMSPSQPVPSEEELHATMSAVNKAMKDFQLPKESNAVVHGSEVPFVPLCGADVAGQATTSVKHKATCRACLERMYPMLITMHSEPQPTLRMDQEGRVILWCPTCASHHVGLVMTGTSGEVWDAVLRMQALEMKLAELLEENEELREVAMRRNYRNMMGKVENQ